MTISTNLSMSLFEPSSYVPDLVFASALRDALETAGVPAELYRPPSWVSPNSVARPFSFPDAIIVSRQLRLVLLPPSSAYTRRMALLENFVKKFPSMRDILGLLNILLLSGGVLELPPLTSHLLSHLAMAHFTRKYVSSEQPNSLIENSTLSSSLSFYSHPADIIHPDGSLDISSEIKAPIIITAAPVSDIKPNGKSTTLAYDFLDLLQ